MEYVKFSLLFFVIHFACYIIAGVIDYQLAKSVYAGKHRLFKAFFRDMDNPRESMRVARLLIPSQLLRAMLMSAVLYPILPFLGELSFGVQFLFMGSLMLIYADVACAVPFANTIEGLVYLQKPIVAPRVFWTIQLEAVTYSSLFGLGAAWLLF
jgi:hypothetical protein